MIYFNFLSDFFEEGDPLWLDNLLFSSSIKSFNFISLKLAAQRSLKKKRCWWVESGGLPLDSHDWRGKNIYSPGRVPQAPSQQGTFESMIFKIVKVGYGLVPRKNILPTSSYNMGPFFVNGVIFGPPKWPQKFSWNFHWGEMTHSSFEKEWHELDVPSTSLGKWLVIHWS